MGSISELERWCFGTHHDNGLGWAASQPQPGSEKEQFVGYNQKLVSSLEMFRTIADKCSRHVTGFGLPNIDEGYSNQHGLLLIQDYSGLFWWMGPWTSPQALQHHHGAGEPKTITYYRLGSCQQMAWTRAVTTEERSLARKLVQPYSPYPAMALRSLTHLLPLLSDPVLDRRRNNLGEEVYEGVSGTGCLPDS